MTSFRIEHLNPILSVKDMEASLSFYVGILGFTNAPWGTGEFTYIEKDNAGLYLCRGAQGGPGTWIWLGFDGDLDTLHSALIDRDVSIALPPANFSWAYEMQVRDPDGHIIRFGTDPRTDIAFRDQVVI